MRLRQLALDACLNAQNTRGCWERECSSTNLTAVKPLRLLNTRREEPSADP